MTLRIIHTVPANGFYNMAVDEALLLVYRDTPWRVPTLRFYTFSPPAITIGRFQALDDINAGANSHSAVKVDIVRRITGGRAILHDGDLTYSLIVPDNDPVFGNSSFNGYKSMSLIFRDALLALGVEAELVRMKHSDPALEYQRNTGCFSSVSRYELQVQGKKILGSAQRRQDGVILQQGSLLVKSKIKMQNAKWAQIGLNEILGREFNIEELILAVKEALKNMGVNIIDGALSPEEVELANKLIPKYQTL